MSASWREQVEAGIADHYAHGKTPKNVPASDAEWAELEAEFPRSLLATWYVLTGRRLERWPVAGRRVV